MLTGSPDQWAEDLVFVCWDHVSATDPDVRTLHTIDKALKLLLYNIFTLSTNALPSVHCNCDHVYALAPEGCSGYNIACSVASN